jgi:glutathione S-transferase
MMLALYGHPFSSYTWKALIALYANDTMFEFRIVDADHPTHAELVVRTSPQGKFPVLVDGDTVVTESTSIIEYLHLHNPGPMPLLPDEPDAAIRVRTLDRLFDNYVMNLMQPLVEEHIRAPNAPDQVRIAEVKARLHRSYAWIEGWLENYPADSDQITLIECAAAPSLFYADWVEPIPDSCPRLKRWRAHLLALPAVKRCVDDARPYRAWFPPGAPDRD